MKKTNYLLAMLLMVASLGMMACGGDDDSGDDEGTSAESLTLVSTTPADGATNVANGTDVVFTFSDNVKSINYTSGSVTINGVEKGATALTKSGKNVTIPSTLITIEEGGKYTIVISAGTIKEYDKAITLSFSGPTDNVAPTMTSVSPSDGKTGIPISKKIQVTYSENVAIANAEGITVNGNAATASVDGNVVTISASLSADTKYEVKIAQGAVTDLSGNSADAVSFSFTTGNSKMSSSLSNPDATSEAKALYQTLLDNYGQKIMIGSMSNVSWNFCEADLVNTATGKYPKMAFMDYIHMFTQRSDYSENWKVSYDIDQTTKDWAANGGYIGASWHWMVPKKAGDKPGIDNLTSDYDAPFDPANIMVEGTYEYEYAQVDLKNLVKYIKQLQDANIPLVFRPFHEASGNTISGGTSWFWWGKDGAETYKELWIYLYNYLKDAGLNNIIWVWTTQTGYTWDGETLKSDEDWYPGDEYVDIIGCDEYTKTVAQTVAQFEFISETFPTKMITLSECGSVANVSEMWNAGAKWSYVMPWYDYDADQAKSLTSHQHANTAWWTDAVNFENSITR